MKTFLILVSTFLGITVYGQPKEDLYLITGHPFSETDDLFESNLWRYDRDSSALIRQIQLSTADEDLSNIKIYVELGYFTLMKKNSWKQEQSYDSLLIFNIDRMELKRKAVGKAGYYIVARANNYLLKLLNNLMVAFDLVNSDDRLYNSYEIDNLKYRDSVELQLYKNVYLTGFLGGEVLGNDFILAYSRKEDGYLEILVSGDRSKRPCFPYELPEKYRFNTYARQLVCINNDNYFLVSGNEQAGVNSLGTVPLFIYDKKNKVWSDKTLLGTLPRIRGFSEWLCGYIGDNGESLLNKPLPGSSLWKDRETGLSPALRYEGMYTPGILYFYNPSTKVYFELQTNQADSEVVLIQDNKVIYRVYDELYETEIVRGKKLGKSVLLLKSDYVPDIHWAFYR